MLNKSKAVFQGHQQIVENSSELGAYFFRQINNTKSSRVVIIFNEKVQPLPSKAFTKRNWELTCCDNKQNILANGHLALSSKINGTIIAEFGRTFN